ncbi:unnamed protein product [Brachionus calyciflorus]|uniref:Transmembrane protein 216 n=1 Tax=Brachionus calyciflorus TaxID=104777 RepID=A0A814DZM4_9BILA|nr:unnamed protein product [Brachionus calyciflorus]
MAADLSVRSSLPLQILLYLNQWYYIFWLIVESLSFVFKGQTLPFASGVLAGEIILFIFLFLLDMFRIHFATKGNLTERIIGIIVSIVLTLPCIGGSLYLLLWQHYVLRIELIINAIQLVFIALEVILEIIAIIVFARSNA